MSYSSPSSSSKPTPPSSASSSWSSLVKKSKNSQQQNGSHSFPSLGSSSSSSTPSSARIEPSGPRWASLISSPAAPSSKPSTPSAPSPSSAAVPSPASSIFTCVICQDSIPKDVELARPASCNHHFCYPCLSEWLTNRQECPTCRVSSPSLMRRKQRSNEQAEEDKPASKPLWSALATKPSSSSSEDPEGDLSSPEDLVAEQEVEEKIVLSKSASWVGNFHPSAYGPQSNLAASSSVDDLGCFDHRFFVGETDRMLSEARALLAPLRQQHLLRANHCRIKTRHVPLEERQYLGLDRVILQLEGMRLDMLRLVRFEPDVTLSTLYEMADIIQRVRSGLDPHDESFSLHSFSAPSHHSADGSEEDVDGSFRELSMEEVDSSAIDAIQRGGGGNSDGRRKSRGSKPKPAGLGSSPTAATLGDFINLNSPGGSRRRR